MSLTRAAEVALLRARIAGSGLSQRQFALEVLRREPRTVERWLAGQRQIPRVVLEFLQDPTRASWP